MIEKLEYQIPIVAKNPGQFTVSGNSYEYFREPTKKEMIDKINEIVQWIQLQK